MHWPVSRTERNRKLGLAPAGSTTPQGLHTTRLHPSARPLPPINLPSPSSGLSAIALQVFYLLSSLPQRTSSHRWDSDRARDSDAGVRLAGNGDFAGHPCISLNGGMCCRWAAMSGGSADELSTLEQWKSREICQAVPKHSAYLETFVRELPSCSFSSSVLPNRMTACPTWGIAA